MPTKWTKRIFPLLLIIFLFSLGISCFWSFPAYAVKCGGLDATTKDADKRGCEEYWIYLGEGVLKWSTSSRKLKLMGKQSGDTHIYWCGEWDGEKFIKNYYGQSFDGYAGKIYDETKKPYEECDRVFRDPSVDCKDNLDEQLQKQSVTISVKGANGNPTKCDPVKFYIGTTKSFLRSAAIKDKPTKVDDLLISRDYTGPVYAVGCGGVTRIDIKNGIPTEKDITIVENQYLDQNGNPLSEDEKIKAGLESAAGETKPTEGKAEGEGEDVYGSLGWIVGPVFRAMAATVRWLFNNLVMPFIDVKPPAVGSDMFAVWNWIRNISNGLLVIVLIVIAFANLFQIRLEQYSIKRLLPKLLVAVILIQLSWLICTAIIESSRVVGNAIGNVKVTSGKSLTYEIENYQPATEEGEENIVLPTRDTPVPQKAETILANVGIVAVGALVLWKIGIFGILFLLLMLLIAIAGVVVTLVLRAFFIYILMAISPIAFLCMILPFTESMTKKWLSEFIKIVFMYPIIMFLLLCGDIIGKIKIEDIFAQKNVVSDIVTLLVQALIIIAVFFCIPWTFKWAGSAMLGISGAVGALAKGARAKFGETAIGQRLQAPQKMRKAMYESAAKMKAIKAMSREGWRGKMARAPLLRPKAYESTLGEFKEASIADAMKAMDADPTGKDGWHEKFLHGDEIERVAAARKLAGSDLIGDVTDDWLEKHYKPPRYKDLSREMRDEITEDRWNAMSKKEKFETHVQDTINTTAPKDMGNVTVPMMKGSGLKYLLKSKNSELKAAGETAIKKMTTEQINSMGKETIHTVLDYRFSDGKTGWQYLDEQGKLWDWLENPASEANARTRSALREKIPEGTPLKRVGEPPQPTGGGGTTPAPPQT